MHWSSIFVPIGHPKEHCPITYMVRPPLWRRPVLSFRLLLKDISTPTTHVHANCSYETWSETCECAILLPYSPKIRPRPWDCWIFKIWFLISEFLIDFKKVELDCRKKKLLLQVPGLEKVKISYYFSKELNFPPGSKSLLSIFIYSPKEHLRASNCFAHDHWCLDPKAHLHKS